LSGEATAARALARTTQLINLDFFDGAADGPEIADALRRTRVRIRADGANLDCAAAQTAIVTLTALVAMLGADIELEIPEVSLVAPQPPLTEDRLRAGLVRAYDDMIPGARVGPPAAAPADVTFVMGDTPYQGEGAAFRVFGGAWNGSIAPALTSPGERWRGCWPVGALAAAGLAAPEALRQVMPRIARELGLELPAARFVPPPAHAAVDLALPVRFDSPHVSAVDVISAGAIANGLVYVLLRLPGIAGQLRVIDLDPLALENLNRYLLSLRVHLGLQKADVLASYTSGKLEITPVPAKLSEENVSELAPFAPRVCVGVDHLPSRWLAQRQQPDWLCVGATSHLDTALVTTHLPGMPCAGCAHPPEPTPFEGDIPTISFVSFWAGLLQARELLAAAAGVSPTAASWRCAPYGLGNPYGLLPWAIAPRRDCPVGCAASRRVAA
jgi:hypothetical protein